MTLYALILSLTPLSGGPVETYTIDANMIRIDCYQAAFQDIELAGRFWDRSYQVSLACEIEGPSK
jgi:hypothetical protein